MGRTILLRARSLPAPAASPPAGRNPPRLAVTPRNGSATYPSPTDASVTLAPSPPSCATGLAATGAARSPGPNSSSIVMPSALANAKAARSDGSDSPDSHKETACRDIPATSASCCWDNPRARRARRSRLPG